MRKQENRQWEQDRRGNSGRQVESFQKITQVRTILPDLQEPTWQVRCHCSGSKHFSPAYEVIACIQVFYLGKVDEVWQWVAWGSATVYLEVPLESPSFPLRTLVGRGGGGECERASGCT